MAATNVQRFSGDVLLSGEMNLQHVSNTASIKLNSNVVTEFPRSKKLIKYPREAIPGNNSAVGSGYTYTASDGDYVIKASSEYDYRFYASNAFDNNKTTQSWLSADSTQGFRYTSGNPITSDTLASSTFTKFGAYGEWIELKLPTSIYLGYVLVYPKDNRVGYLNTSAIVWGSNTGNDGEWQRLSTFTSFGNYSEANPAKIVIDSLVSYNYYAYQITGINSTTTQYSVVSELEYFGTPEYDPDAHGTDVTIKSYPNVPNTDWLEVYYDAKGLENGTTTVNDLKPSGTANNGVANGNLSVSDGAFTFDGSGDYISTSITTPMTYHTASMWIQFDSPSAWECVYFIGPSSSLDRNNFNLYTSNGYFRLESPGGTNAPFFDFLYDFEIGKWVHLTLVFRGSGLEDCEMYINNTKLFNSGGARRSSSDDITITGTNNVYIGSDFGNSYYHDGKIANFRLFNRALTSDEVWQLYAYQKEYFGYGDLSMTLKAGRLGIGTSEPRAALDVRGDIYSRDIYGGCPVYFLVHFTSDVSGNTTYIDFDNITHNKGGGWGDDTTKFYAPKTGYYHFSISLMGTYINGRGTVIEWMKNGNRYVSGTYSTIYDYFSGGHSEHMHVSGSMIMYLEVGDWMGIKNGASTLQSGYNQFTGFYLSS
jgi:hypothetical protein